MTIRKHFLIATLPFITITLFLVGILTEREYKNLTINTASHFADTIVSQTSILVSTRCSEYEDSLLNDILNWKLFDNYLNTSISTQIKQLEVRSFTNTRNTRKSPIQEIWLENLEKETFYFNPSLQTSNPTAEVTSIMQEISERCWTNTTSRTEWSAPDPSSTKVYLSRKIYSPITLKAEGIMIVSIARKNIEDLYQIMADSHQGTIFILSNKDSMITGDSSLLPVYYACKKQASTDLFQYDGVSYLFRQSVNRDNNWTTAFLLSEKELFAGSAPIRLKIYSITILSLLLIIISIVIASQRVTRELQRFSMELQTENTSSAVPNPINAVYYTTEICQLQLIYNHMIKGLSEVSARLFEQQRITEESRYLALQAEYQELCLMINPHFIYNAMDSINSIAKLNHQDDIVYLCTALSRLMRAALTQQERYITLKKELSYLKDYLNIQHYIMGDRLEIVYDLDSSLEEFLIPPLLLQPIAENCFVHGFLSDQPSIIFIATTRTEIEKQPCMMITISDNGYGIDRERIQEIYQSAAQPIHQNSHVGLIGSIRRLQLLYPSPYRIHIQSKKGDGTTIKIPLPLQKGESDL